MRTRAYRAAEAIRHSLRNGFTAYNALSPVIGLLATVAPKKLASREHDASAEASGPHVFAVRSTRLRQKASPGMMPFVKGTSASTATRPTFVTLADAPCRDGMAIEMSLIFPSGKAKYFDSWA
jgi:hypothetical protein